MKCSNCGAESPGSGPFCAQCGAPLRQDTLRPTSTFSYLPEGTPPWPTTIPDKLPFVTQASNKESTTTPEPVSKPVERKKTPTRQLVLTALLVVLVPLLGVLATLGTL